MRMRFTRAFPWSFFGSMAHTMSLMLRKLSLLVSPIRAIRCFTCSFSALLSFAASWLPMVMLLSEEPTSSCRSLAIRLRTACNFNACARR